MKTSVPTFPIKGRGESGRKENSSLSLICLSPPTSHVRLITNRGNSDRFHSLKVSYDHLEERVGDCFLVCSLLKKGKNIMRGTHLQWWTRQGLLDMNHVSVRGQMIITNLLIVGLLQKVDNNHKYLKYSYVKVYPILQDMFF